METNEAVTLETTEQFREAIGVLAGGYTQLEALLKAQGELIKGMDARIKLLTALVDSHHETLIKNGLAAPRPAGGSLAN